MTSIGCEYIVKGIEKPCRLAHLTPVRLVSGLNRRHPEVGLHIDGGQPCLGERPVSGFGWSLLTVFVRKWHITEHMPLSKQLCKTTQYRHGRLRAKEIHFAAFRFAPRPLRVDALRRAHVDVQDKVRWIPIREIIADFAVHFLNHRIDTALIILNGVKSDVPSTSQPSACVAFRDIATELRLLLMVARDHQGCDSPHTNHWILVASLYKPFGLCHVGVTTFCLPDIRSRPLVPGGQHGAPINN